MGIGLTREELCEAVNGRTIADGSSRIVMQGVAYDSREVRGGELFVALRGEATHGHSFVATALSRGAAAVLVEDEGVARASSAPERCVVVRDTLEAFQCLAQWWRRRLCIPVIGITGSVGKTTTKEFLAHLLLRKGVGTFSLKSHNNHVGVPYTICRISPSDSWAVIEMGMNHAGEIARLSQIAAPTIAVITAIAPAHIENFRDIHGIADAKLEIVQGLQPGGALIINGDDEVLRSAVERSGFDRGRTFEFGTGVGARCRIREVSARGLDGLRFSWELDGGGAEANLGILGLHNAGNAAAALLAAKIAFPAMSVPELNEDLLRFRAPLMRLQRTTLADGRVVIDDSYNANPASMKAMLTIVADLVKQGRSVGVILGDMRELGAQSAELHREVGRAVREARPTFLITVGEQARLYAAEAGSAIPHYEAENPVHAGHVAGKRKSDILFVKASRALGLDASVRVLIDSIGERIAPPSSSERGDT